MEATFFVAGRDAILEVQRLTLDVLCYSAAAYLFLIVTLWGTSSHLPNAKIVSPAEFLDTDSLQLRAQIYLISNVFILIQNRLLRLFHIRRAALNQNKWYKKFPFDVPKNISQIYRLLKKIYIYTPPYSHIYYRSL